MSEPRWVSLDAMTRLHDLSIARFGGVDGLRDEGLLLSALARPENRCAYEGETDLLVLAATYVVGIAKNHPFADGNKRAAFLGCGLFLELNGLQLTASQEEATATMMAVASGEMDVDALTVWLRVNVAAG